MNDGLQSVFITEEFVAYGRHTQMEEVSVTQNEELTLMKDLNVKKIMGPDGQPDVL